MMIVSQAVIPSRCSDKWLLVRYSYCQDPTVALAPNRELVLLINTLRVSKPHHSAVILHQCGKRDTQGQDEQIQN